MLSRTLLGMRCKRLIEDTRQMLLDRADIDGFNGADGDRYSRVDAPFPQYAHGNPGLSGNRPFFRDMGNNGIFIDDDAVISRI